MKTGIVSILKLVNGDEVIARVDEIESDFINLSDPMVIVGLQSEGGTPMRLKDYMLLAKDTVMTMPTKFIMCAYAPTDSLATYYVSAVEFNRKNTKPTIEALIASACKEMQAVTEEVEDLDARFKDVILKSTGRRLN